MHNFTSSPDLILPHPVSPAPTRAQCRNVNNCRYYQWWYYDINKKHMYHILISIISTSYVKQWSESEPSCLGNFHHDGMWTSRSQFLNKKRDSVAG